MSRHVGPFRTAAGLAAALGEIARLEAALGDDAAAARRGAFDTARLDWFDLRNMLLVAEAVARGRARAHRKPRRASARGFSGPRRAWAVNQTVRLADGRLALARVPVAAAAAAQ